MSADAVESWARSGAMVLTASRSGRPTVVGAGAAFVMHGALSTTATLTEERTSRAVALPGVELLGERAAIAGLRRAPGQSVGGAMRSIRALDGWLALSLPRRSDIDAVPALVEGVAGDDPWRAVALWSARLPAVAAVDRAQLLGLAAAVIRRPGTTDVQLIERGDVPVVTTLGGLREPDVPAPLVIDLSSLWAGPLCAHLLGLGGARVVKVESTRRLDGARLGPAAFYDLLNAGHDSVTVDLTTEAGRDRLRHLIDRADVVIESARPRAMAQLGIDVTAAVDRGVIWTSITAYGRTGHWAQRIGFGDDVAAAAGLVADLDGVPVPVGDAIADPLTGAVAAAAVSSALRTEHGQLIDISMRDVARTAAAVPVGKAAVTKTADGWCVDTEAGRHVVAAPSARKPIRRAAPPGADNDRWLARALSS